MLSRKLGGRILVLQPRRVAARMLAKSVGKLFDMRDEVGWHVRFEKRYGEDTKIVFLTEGILARMLLADPQLKGVSAVVFDEFHERNIYADVLPSAHPSHAERFASGLGDSCVFGVDGLLRAARISGR